MQLIPLGRFSLISLMLIGATMLPVVGQSRPAENEGPVAPIAAAVPLESETLAAASSPNGTVAVGSEITLSDNIRAAIPPTEPQNLARPEQLASRDDRRLAEVQASLSPEEKKAREAEEKEAEKAQRQRAEAEAKQRREEEKAREAAEKAEAEAKAKLEATAKAEAEAAERKVAAEQAKAEAEAKKRAEEQARAEAEAKARAEADKAKAEAEEKAKLEAARLAEEKAKREAAAAEEKAKREAAAAEARAKREAAEAEAKARTEARQRASRAVRSAETALRNGRLDEAEKLLAEAKTDHESHPRIAPLERRLKSAQEARAKREEEKARQQAAREEREAEKAAAAATAAASLAPIADEATPANAVAEADDLARQARRLLSDGNRAEAMDMFRRAVALDSTNVEASARLRELEGGAGNAEAAAGGVPPLAPAGGTAAAVAAPVATRPASDSGAPAPNFRPSTIGRSVEESQSAFQRGLSAYQQGRLDTAVQLWNQALSLNPANQEAQRYLSQTRAEYEAYVRQNQNAATRVQRAARATEKLATPVTYDTAGEKSIAEFLSAMSLIGDISFSVAPGVDPDVRITAKLDDVPLRDALDIVLLPMGLKWNRAGDVVTVVPDLRTRFFNLTQEQVTRLRPLLERRTLQRFLYGPEGVPTMRSTELLLDEANNTLLVTDSQENINKVEAFLRDLQTVAPAGLQFRNFKIRPEEGQRIRALVEAVIRTQSDAPYDMERRVVVDRDDLIVKDTAQNIARIEQLLLDKNFLRKIETQQLGVQTFNLSPREPIGENIEQVRELANNIVIVVKTILYAQVGEAAAAAEGRRYFYDPNTLQLTITDFPDNLRAVSDYIRSLPQLTGSRRRSEIIYLKHQSASELAELLQRVLGINQGGGTSAANDSAQTTVRSLRTNQEITFRDIRIRNVRVQAGPTENEDDVTILIRGGTQGSQEQTIREFRSVFFEDYEITALDIRPSSAIGEGTARLEIRFAPQGGLAGGTGQVVEANETPQPAVAEEDAGISIETVDNLNALLIRYQDSAQLQEIRGWIEALDTPVLQVSIETKLVEVNETRAKEWMPEFNILDLKKASIGGATGSSRFANNTDQLVGAGAASRSPFDPFPVDINTGVPLIKGSTVLNAVTDSLNFSLRMLEQEGVVNMVNGPHVLVENGGSVNFTIEKVFPASIVPVAVGNVAGGGNNQGGNNNAAQGGRSATLRNVDLQMSPTITQLGEIRLDIQTLELQDMTSIMSETYITNTDTGDDGDLTVTSDPSIAGDLQQNFNNARSFVTRRRTLETVARVNNGGTIVLGGWNGEQVRNLDAGVPLLRQLPYVGRLLFNRTQDKIDKTNLLIFLTCNIVNP
jgi:type II secretory pathway component GspD/PulD (secretin)